MKICLISYSPSGHPRYRWVWLFIRTNCAKLLFITCSPMDPLQWMGAVRMRVQTADNNITSNPHHSSPVHQLTSCEVKSYVFVRNKSIIKVFFNSKVQKSRLSIILLSPVKNSPHLNQGEDMHRWSTLYKWKLSKLVRNYMLLDFDVREKQGINFLICGNIIMNYGLIFWL